MKGNMVWCHSHQRFEPANDLIGFPVSDDWLDFYHRQGLTTGKSPHYYSSTEHETCSVNKEALERIVSLELKISWLHVRCP